MAPNDGSGVGCFSIDSEEQMTQLIANDSANELNKEEFLIYFDCNGPVITNNAVAAIVQTTAVTEWLANRKLSVYPNPAKDVLMISLPTNVLQGMLMVYDL